MSCMWRKSAHASRLLATRASGLALLALLLQLSAPALLLPHLHAFHSGHHGSDPASGDEAAAGKASCHHDQRGSTVEPSSHDHAHCVVCQLAMQVQHGGLSASLSTLPPIGTLPVPGPAAILAAPGCTSSVRLPDICGPPVG